MSRSGTARRSSVRVRRVEFVRTKSTVSGYSKVQECTGPDVFRGSDSSRFQWDHEVSNPPEASWRGGIAQNSGAAATWLAILGAPATSIDRDKGTKTIGGAVSARASLRVGTEVSVASTPRPDWECAPRDGPTRSGGPMGTTGGARLGSGWYSCRMSDVPYSSRSAWWTGPSDPGGPCRPGPRGSRVVGWRR